MKIKEGFVLRQVAGMTMVIATGEASKNFHGMIKLNDTAAEIWNGLLAGDSAEEIAERFSQQHSISIEKATADVQALIKQMDEAGFLES